MQQLSDGQAASYLLLAADYIRAQLHSTASWRDSVHMICCCPAHSGRTAIILHERRCSLPDMQTQPRAFYLPDITSFVAAGPFSHTGCT